MPSHSAASALVKLFEFKGAPWDWPAWQERTGISHGLFPSDDKHLPPGWTRKDATDIHSYFLAYNRLGSEAKKLQFSTKSKGNSAHPGRETWGNFVNKYWSRWGVHDVIVSELKEYDVHPMMILIRENGINDAWPSADFYIPKILDSLGMRLFGEEAFPDGVEILRTDLRKCLQIFVQRAWNMLRTQVNNMRNRQNLIEATALAAFTDLENELSRAKINQAIRATAKWRECAELFSTPENVARAEEMLGKLQVVMEGLGAKIPSHRRVKAKGPCKITAQALANLASEEDVSDLLNVYDEYFDSNFECEDEPVILDSLPERGRLTNDDGDFGMEVEANMKYVSFLYQFGFPQGLPVQFNSRRHKSGITAWEDPVPFKEERISPALDKMVLHWHQLAGVHSMVRSIFTKEKDATHTTGVLVGDEVGLGKTAQAITFIAFLNQSILGDNRHVPRVLDERRFLGGTDKIPSLPHLIFCPGTLSAQWIHELKVLFLPKSVDIIPYDSQTDPRTFWGPNGPLRRSKHKLHNCIIVASHSAIFRDFKTTHRKEKKGARPWDIPPAKQTLAGTIFGESFLTITIDEAHHMRNAGNKHTASLRLLQQARIRLVMTATPLHTAPKDISSLARLVGIPHFFTEESFIEEKSDVAKFRRAKKLDDDGETLLTEQLQVVRRLQGYCQGNFLRRTATSRDWEGKVLLPLPPYIEIIGVLNLTERERTIIEERSEAAKAAVLSCSNARIQTKKFYLEYRTAVGYAKEDPAVPWPSFKSLEDWMPVMSTKMDVCARICAHYLTHDDVEDVTFEDGQAVFPETPIPPEEEIRKTRRIIIYSEFSSMAPLLQNVLQLYGVLSLAINGKTPFQQRDRRIRDLYDQQDPNRVLIFSSVGSAGLNLAVADVVIFFDQPWSAQDERQIRGRAHRQPQKKNVKVVHLLASDSADLLMNDVARGKRDMFDAFVNKELREELSMLLQGRIPDSSEAPQGEGEVKDEVVPRPKRKRSRRVLVVDDDEGDTPSKPADKVGEDPQSDGANSSMLSYQSSASDVDMPADLVPESESHSQSMAPSNDTSAPVYNHDDHDGMDTDPGVTGPLESFGHLDLLEHEMGSCTNTPAPTRSVASQCTPALGDRSPPPKRPRNEPSGPIAHVSIPENSQGSNDGTKEMGGNNLPTRMELATHPPSQFDSGQPIEQSTEQNPVQGSSWSNLAVHKPSPPVTRPQQPNAGASGLPPSRNPFRSHPPPPMAGGPAPVRQPGPLKNVTIPPKSNLTASRNTKKSQKSTPPCPPK